MGNGTQRCRTATLPETAPGTGALQEAFTADIPVRRAGYRRAMATTEDLRSTATTDFTPNRPLAVVTGASSGIGFELAAQFADHGFDLIVTADSDRIQSAGRTLAARGTTIEVIQVDLATYDGVERLYQAIRATGRPVAAIALNAGRGIGGEFARTTDLADELEVIDLNVRSTVHLAKRVISDMVGRGEGRVLFTSSIASMMPGAYQAVYNASKSFVQSFAQALRTELEGTGVTVTSLMPGPTDTRFFERAEMLDTPVGAGSKDDPAKVARLGFEALMGGEDRVVAASLKTKAQAAASRILPDSVKSKLHAKMAEPGGATES
jgi:uncharacterized protein